MVEQTIHKAQSFTKSQITNTMNTTERTERIEEEEEQKTKNNAKIPIFYLTS